MRKFILYLTLLCGGVNAQTPIKPIMIDDQTVELWLCIGQSNAPTAGRADTTGLDVSYLRTQDFIKIWNKAGGVGNAFANFQVRGLHNNQYITSTTGGIAQFGGEITFAQGQRNKDGRKVYIVSNASGSTYLYNTTTYLSWFPNQVGKNDIFDSTMKRMSTAKTWLTTNNIPYSLKGIIWYQGESDAHYDYCANAYQVNEKMLFDSLIARYGSGIVIVDCLIKSTEPYTTTINAAKTTNAGLLPNNVILVDTQDLTYGVDGVHLNAASQLTLGTRISAAIPKWTKAQYILKHNGKILKK